MSTNPETIVIAVFEDDALAGCQREVRELVDMIDELDPRARFHGSKLAIFRMNGVDQSLLDEIRNVSGVCRVMHLPHAHRLYSRHNGDKRKAVRLPGGLTFGDGSLSVIAGPCSVESRDQVFASAEIVAATGAKALRGGVFKPRSSPYMFGGLGERGLELLHMAGQRTGLPICTEVLCVSQVELVAKWADILQIGSRNMSNFPLLFAVGANSKGKPVLLKRGLGATLAEFLDAAEYVLLGRLSTGHTEPGLILCERGIRTFAPALRFTLDVGIIPLLQAQTHLPIIADPSHAAGERSLVPPLGRAAIAAGADGLLVEVHVDPDHAWCDGAQSVDAPGFASLMHNLQRYALVEEVAAE